MFDILIVGAGPAGLSAAIYGARAGKTVIVIEALRYGGQIVNSTEVENFPGIKKISGFEFATNLYEQAKSFGVEVVSMEVTEILERNDHVKVVKGKKKEYEAKTVILATGVKRKLLHVPREKELTGAGVSYCATCDGMFFRGKKVAVVGGGNTALEDAIYLSDLCEQVTIIHRRNKFRGEEHLINILKQKANIDFLMDMRIVELIGEPMLESIVVQKMDGQGQQTIEVSGLFIAIGYEPANQAFANVVELDEYGFVIAGEDTKTSAEGIFAAGDGRTKSVRQLTTATSDGAVAAISACNLLMEE